MKGAGTGTLQAREDFSQTVRSGCGNPAIPADMHRPGTLNGRWPVTSDNSFDYGAA
jgi:hypothetical protein